MPSLQLSFMHFSTHSLIAFEVSIEDATNATPTAPAATFATVLLFTLLITSVIDSFIVCFASSGRQPIINSPILLLSPV